MNLYSIVNSKFSIAFALLLSKTLPPAIAYRVADFLTWFVSQQKQLDIVRAVRVNQWVIHDQAISAHQLDVCVKAVFKRHFRSLYDLYHHINLPDKISKKVIFSPELQNLLHEHEQSKHALMILIPHLSNFDLAGRALAIRGVKYSILSYPQPPSGYRWQNKLRQEVGIEVLPMSLSSLRQAGERLQAGGLVITGVDRPMEQSNYHPIFFNQPTMIPVTPVRLALKYDAQVVICACIARKKRKYEIIATAPIQMVRNPNLQVELTSNTERVLQEVEKLVRTYPDQWAMFYPVWPQLFGTMP